MTNIVVIIPAAGVGSRLNSSPPKQFVKIDGLPLLFYTIDSFARLNYDAKIVVVCPQDFMSFVRMEVLSYFEDQMNKGSIVLVAGSYSRHRSIALALDIFQCFENKPDLVIIQDGVRPLVDQQLLSRLIESAELHGAAGPVCDLVSTTLKIDGDGFVEHGLDRSCYKQSEMPQVFKYDVIRHAYERASVDELDHGTECLELVKKYTKAKVKYIEASSGQLFKVTYKKDLYAVEGLLKGNLKSKFHDKNILFPELRLVKLIPMCSTMDDDFLIIKELERNLRLRFKRLSIETYRNGFNVGAPNQSLVFIYFTSCWESIKLDEEQSNWPRIHLILVTNELSDSDYAQFVKSHRNHSDNYIIGKVANNFIRILQILGNILWDSHHARGQIHFL